MVVTVTGLSAEAWVDQTVEVALGQTVGGWGGVATTLRASGFDENSVFEEAEVGRVVVGGGGVARVVVPPMSIVQVVLVRGN